jgi:four helix bundle protein
MHDFRRLKVWEKAHRLTLAIYRSSAEFPTSERYGLTSQLRRSSSSIASNIAEGCGRGTRPDFARFLRIAMGSASEVEYQIQLALDLGFLEREVHCRLTNEIVEVKKMLSSLIERLRTDPPSPTTDY